MKVKENNTMYASKRMYKYMDKIRKKITSFQKPFQNNVLEAGIYWQCLKFLPR
jgi:hypothetical protein